MRRFLFLIAASWLLASPAQAQRVVYLDFSNWSLDTLFTTINGNSPPTQTDLDLVRETVIWEVVRNFAPFDVYVTDEPPVLGAYSLLRFVPTPQNGSTGVLGASGTSSGACTDCTGIDSWDQPLSIAEVYVGNFATQSALSGSSATTTRIARALAHAATHEVGHNLGLFHCNSCDDFFAASIGTVDATCFGNSSDANTTSHIMASGASTGLTNTQRATVNDFFSVHSSRRVLFSNLQPRGHWGRLQDIDDDFDADLTYACLADYDTVEWFNRDSDGIEFEPETVFDPDAGRANDIFMHGDVTGDGQADLVLGRIIDTTTIKWRVRPSTGIGFGASSVWRSDAGTVGDVFRLADVDGDGMKDLVVLHPVDPSAVLGWSVEVYESTGSAFSNANTVVLSQANEPVSDWLVADANGDGRDDLVNVHRDTADMVAEMFASDGSTFSRSDGTQFSIGFDGADYLHTGDTNGDGFDDLIVGDVVDDSTVTWLVALRLPGCVSGLGIACYLGFDIWHSDGSSAGDETHVGDADNDGRVDLLYGRATGLDDLTATPDRDPIKWRARRSTGIAFGGLEVWAEDAAGDGWLVP